MSGAKPLKDLRPRPETPALSRAGRKTAEAIMEAAQFKPNADGSRYRSAVRSARNRSDRVDQCREIRGDETWKRLRE